MIHDQCLRLSLPLVQEKRRRDLALQNFQLAVTAGLPPLGGNQLGLPSPGSGPVRPQLPGVSSSNMLMEGFPHNLLQSGTPSSSALCEYPPVFSAQSSLPLLHARSALR